MSRVVIKSHHSHSAAPGSSGRYGLDLRDIAEQAAGILEAARMEARRLVQEARTSAEAERQRVLQSAHRQGYEDGLAKGQEAGRAAALEESRNQFAGEQAALVSTLSHLVDAFKDSRERLYAEARRDVIVLAAAIASRILNRLMGADELASDAATEACREALELIGEVTEVVVRAHPQDVAIIGRFCEDLAAGMLPHAKAQRTRSDANERPSKPTALSAPLRDSSRNSSRHVRLLEDAAVGRGGVIVETADTVVNATVAARVEKIVDELVSGWRERMPRLGIEGLRDIGTEGLRGGTASSQSLNPLIPQSLPGNSP